MTRSRGCFQACNLGPGRPATIFRSPIRFLIRASRAGTRRHACWRIWVHDRHSQMGIHQMLGRTIAKSLAIQLLLVGYCAAQTVDDPGPLRVGDRWSYDIKDEVTGDLRNAITVVVAEITQ